MKILKDWRDKNSKGQDLLSSDEPTPPDTSFKVFSLATSHFPENNLVFIPDMTQEEKTKALQEHIEKAKQDAFDESDKLNLLSEVALKDGFTLDVSMIKAPNFDQNDVYIFDDGQKKARLCLDSKIAQNTVDILVADPEQRFICLDRAVDINLRWTLGNSLGDNLWVV